jgi:membrane-associated PAP2 superfamily phosphatase
METFAKIMGYSIFGAVLTTGVVVFVSSATKLCIFLYRHMSVPRALIYCLVCAALLGCLLGFSNSKKG